MKSSSKIFGVKALVALNILVWQPQQLKAQSSETRLNEIDTAIEFCLLKASRPGFPYYHRPEAKEACNMAKSFTKELAEVSNRNRNLGCSRRALRMRRNLWMIEFLGEARMRKETEKAVHNLRKACYSNSSR